RRSGAHRGPPGPDRTRHRGFTERRPGAYRQGRVRMKPNYPSFSDDEIARYVLGLDMPDRVAEIQSRLAHDDAAAARALKWEAYFLGIVDALPAQPPSDAVLDRIRQSLGMEMDEPPVMGESATDSAAQRPTAVDGSRHRRAQRGVRLRRG